MRSLIAAALVVFLVTSSAYAESTDFSSELFTSSSTRDVWTITWLPTRDETTPATRLHGIEFPAAFLTQEPAQPIHAAAVEHSDAYQTRAKIHKYASFATLPLFAAEFALGQSLYDGSGNGSWRRGAHAAVGTGIVGLFGVNTVTGAWNLFGEGWSDKDGRTLRLVHGLLMMAGDVGFLATTASGPNSGGRNGALTFATDKVTHRNLAIASISVSTAGYLLMIIGNR